MKAMRGAFRATAILSILLITSVLMQIAVGLPCVLLVYPLNRWNRRAYIYASRTIGTLCQAHWVQLLAFLLPKTRLIITGDLPTDKGPTLLMVNHQLDCDWWYAWALALCSGETHAGRVKIMLKDSIKYIPILGWGCWFFGFIFVKRNWKKDATRLIKALNDCVSDGLPIRLLMFPEGTTINTEAFEKGVRFAEESGRQSSEHLLLPRDKALNLSLDAYANQAVTLYDITIAYPGYTGEIPSYAMGYGRAIDKSLPTMAKVLQGFNPSHVAFHVERIEGSTIPVDKRQEWLDRQWEKKDKLLQHYIDHGFFPASSGQTQSVYTPAGSLHGIAFVIGLFAAEISLVWWVWNLFSQNS